ncbi:MAG: hypothetical protein ACJ73D_04225 [Pyrinomonadaceae bacterium]
MKALILMVVGTVVVAVLLLTTLLGSAANADDTSRAVFAEGYVGDFHSLTKEEIAGVILDVARNNPDALRSLAGDPAKRKQQLDSLKELLTFANEAVNSRLSDQPTVHSELENIRVEVVAVDFEKRSHPSATPFGSSVTDAEIAAFKMQPSFRAAFASFLDSKLSILKRTDPDRQISNDERSQAEDIFARTRILAAQAAAQGSSVNPADVLRITVQVKLQQAQFLAREYTEIQAGKDTTPVTAAEIAEYRKGRGFGSDVSDDTVRRDIRQDHLETSWPALAKAANILVPDDFEVPALPSRANSNSNRAVNRQTRNTNR